ncbi:MAG: DUF1552 domain-containing protein [Planctomycetaceae bacterium]|nr:DUF1552 domain-containing protein [Planctomycetaceae bacterium]
MKKTYRKITSRSPLGRRTFLHGMGAVMGLPLLEGMTAPLLSAAETAPAIPSRLAFIFFPNGAIMPDWRPEGEGHDYKLSKTLQPLAKVKDDCLIISGLAHDKARPNGDGAGDHARCSGAFLTSSQPRKTGGADIHLGISIDQVAAGKIGHLTPLPSLELGTEAGRKAGVCDSGYSCAYQSNVSWRSPTQPMAKEINPKLAFERLFGMSVQDVKQRQDRDFYRSSILDLVSEDANNLQKRLGKTDSRKMDEYFTSVREIEQRIGRSESTKRELPPGFDFPDGVPSDITEHIRLMYDILTLAFQTDSTRVATFMLANAGSNRRYGHLDVKEAHHQMSHHRNDEAKMADIQKIDQFLVTEYSRFLQKLKSIPERDGTLLDNCTIVYSSGISDANRHFHHDLPLVIGGRGAGKIKTGRHLNLKEETPMANLFLSLLDNIGTPVSEFGDSTGKLNGLA